METIIEVTKYQNITDRLARLMKSSKANQNSEKSQTNILTSKFHKISQSSFINQQQDLTQRLQETSNKICFDFNKVSNEFESQYNERQTLRKIKSEDRLKKLLNKNGIKQIFEQRQFYKNDKLASQKNQNLIDKKLFFKQFNEEKTKQGNEITKMIELLRQNQKSNFNTRQTDQLQSNCILSSKSQNVLIGKERGEKQKNLKYFNRNEYLQSDSNHKILTKNAFQQQFTHQKHIENDLEKKQKIFGKRKHQYHKSNADISTLAKVKSQNKLKIPLFQYLKTEQSLDQTNHAIQPTLRYSNFQSNVFDHNVEIKIRNKNDFQRAPGKIFKNK